MPLLAVALAAAALSPGVQPLAPAGQAQVVGDAVDVADSAGGHVTVTRYPLDGTSATSLLDYPVPGGQIAALSFDATPQRAALGFNLINPNGTLGDTVGFLGGTGPLAPFTPAKGTFAYAAVSADTAFVTANTDAEGAFTRTFAVAADGAQRPIDLPDDEALPVFAGDFLAYSQTSDPSEPASALRLYDWRTGSTVRRVNITNDIVGLDVRDDGAMVVDADGKGTQTVLPRQAPKRIYRGGGDPIWAGDRVVVLRHRRGGYLDMVMVDPNGSHRTFGIASRTLRGVSADANTVSWTANGCAMTMPTTGGPVTKLNPGPCAHSEAMITNTDYAAGQPALGLRVRCFYADDACTGTITVRREQPVDYRVPAGTQQTVAIPLSPRTVQRWAADKDGYVSRRTRMTLNGGHTTVTDQFATTRNHPGSAHHD